MSSLLYLATAHCEASRGSPIRETRGFGNGDPWYVLDS
jgi:hypothetical protein